MEKNKISIEIVYASKEKQVVLGLQVTVPCTVGEAIQQSGILKQFPEIDMQVNKIGIFSKLVALDRILQAGDRVEIYRPLALDPKQERLQRAQRQRTKA